MRCLAVLFIAALFLSAWSKWSSTASQGHTALFPIKQEGNNFCEELAAVTVCSGRGYIDRSGKLVWQTIDLMTAGGRPLEE